jgi:hypothetical protein
MPDKKNSDIKIEQKRKDKIIDTLSIINPLADAKESVSTTFKLIVSALTLVSALAWNEAIKGVFEYLKQNELLKNAGLAAPFIYAILVTVLVIFVTNRIQKIEDKIAKDKEKKLKEIIK